jgi:hypothetical protein
MFDQHMRVDIFNYRRTITKTTTRTTTKKKKNQKKTHTKKRIAEKNHT